MGRLPSWVYGLRDLSGGGPVRLSVRHTGPPGGGGGSVVLNAWPDYPPAAADHPATMWQCAHARQALRSISRQEGGEEHDFCDCGTLH
jgi:hypothetical protein